MVGTLKNLVGRIYVMSTDDLILVLRPDLNDSLEHTAADCFNPRGLKKENIVAILSVAHCLTKKPQQDTWRLWPRDVPPGADYRESTLFYKAGKGRQVLADLFLEAINLRSIKNRAQALEKDLEFARKSLKRPRQKRALVVHCVRGRSRSNVLALAIVADAGKNQASADEIVSSFKKICPYAQLRTGEVAFVDAHLGFKGQLIEAARKLASPESGLKALIEIYPTIKNEIEGSRRFDPDRALRLAQRFSAVLSPKP